MICGRTSTAVQPSADADRGCEPSGGRRADTSLAATATQAPPQTVARIGTRQSRCSDEQPDRRVRSGDQRVDHRVVEPAEPARDRRRPRAAVEQAADAEHRSDAQRECRRRCARNTRVRRQDDGDRGRDRGEEGKLVRDASEPRSRTSVASACDQESSRARSVDADRGTEVGRCSSNPRCCGRISAAPVVRAPHPHDSTGRLSALFRRCVPETLTAQETRLVQPVPAARPSDISDDLPAVPVQIEFLTESHLLGRLQLVDAAVRILECEERRHITLIDTLGANLKDGKPWATLHVFVAVGRGRLSGVSARSRSLITVSPLHAVPPQNPRSRMSKRTERSDEPNPFDSRRTTRVVMFTPRNPGPTDGARGSGREGRRRSACDGSNRRLRRAQSARLRVLSWPRSDA